MTSKQLLHSLWIAFALTLVACSGGDSAPSEAPQRTTAMSGTITGLSDQGKPSITVEGETVDLSNADINAELDPSAPESSSGIDLKIGQDVFVTLKGKHATQITIRPMVVGPVQSIDLADSSFTVLNQTIRVIASGDTQTFFEGFAGLAELAPDQWVVVYGALDADHNIEAARVVLSPTPAATNVRVGGLIQNLDPSKHTFTLGGLTINYAKATIVPDNATLANDLWVFVFSDTLPQSAELAAQSIRVANAIGEAHSVILHGLVADFASLADFRVSGFSIDASEAQIKGGQGPTEADIANMVWLKVEGTLEVVDSSVKVKATRLWRIPASERRRIVLAGMVTDFVSAADFKVRGTPIDADTAVFKNGAKLELGNTMSVQVKGRIEGAHIKADEVMLNVSTN